MSRHRLVAATRVGVSLLVVFVVAIVVYIALPVVQSAPSVAVPASCSAASAAHAFPTAAVPSAELEGSVIAHDGSIDVIDVRPASGSSGGTVYVVARDSRITRRVHLDSDMAVAAIRGRYVYLYNDKIGYVIHAETGRSAPSWVEVDNYRGLYEHEGQRRVQTQGVVTLLGPSLGVVRSTLSFTGIANGCAVGTAS